MNQFFAAAILLCGGGFLWLYCRNLPHLTPSFFYYLIVANDYLWFKEAFDMTELSNWVKRMTLRRLPAPDGHFKIKATLDYKENAGTERILCHLIVEYDSNGEPILLKIDDQQRRLTRRAKRYLRAPYARLREEYAQLVGG